MLIRTLCGFALLPLLIIVIFFAPLWVLPCVVALLMAMAQYELLWSTGISVRRLPVLLSALAAAAVPAWVWFGCNPVWGLAGATLFIALLFLLAMTSEGEFKFSAAAAAAFSALVVPLFVSSAVALAAGEHGRELIVLPFIGAWMSDTGAYFVGSFFGRHKLCPSISPKKTVEGSLGGIGSTVLAGVIYGLIMQYCFDFSVNYISVCIICAAGSVFGQLGDLIFSFIKREAGIKDYANLVPGQGGVMDRFDSLFLAAPAVCALLRLLPAVLK